jgi:hypothetical protein
VLIAADDDADAEVDGAGAEVRAAPPAELLPELHAATATVSVTPTASAGTSLTAWPALREACR